MQLGRVRGTVVATIKDPGMSGMKLLIVQPLDEHQTPVGECVVAADAVHQAGEGDLIYFVASREAAEAQVRSRRPCDCRDRRRCRGEAVKVGRVIGNVVSTINHEFFDGERLLLVRLVDDGRDTGSYLICTDVVGAGADETVLVLDEGSSARKIYDVDTGPIRSVVVGIVDEIHEARDRVPVSGGTGEPGGGGAQVPRTSEDRR